ncbi:MAG: hypothetical protein GF383_02980, partial [Candidatus Lokiarchaeota archaeon]|nr:hypothetical protein [Candidatus Lokiarchaeota archaeon]
MQEHTGINICTLVLADEGSIDEDIGCLASGMVKAIRDFLKELRFGKIKNFLTHERKVIIYKEGEILTALICDENDNSELYYPKVKKIAEIFNDTIREKEWTGELSVFADAISTSRQLIKLSDKEIVEYIN